MDDLGHEGCSVRTGRKLASVGSHGRSKMTTSFDERGRYGSVCGNRSSEFWCRDIGIPTLLLSWNGREGKGWRHGAWYFDGSLKSSRRIAVNVERKLLECAWKNMYRTFYYYIHVFYAAIHLETCRHPLAPGSSLVPALSIDAEQRSGVGIGERKEAGAF